MITNVCYCGRGGGGGGPLGGGRGLSGLLPVMLSVSFCMELDKDFSRGLGGSFGVDLVLGGREGGMCRSVGVDGAGRTILVCCIIGCSGCGLLFNTPDDWKPEQFNCWVRK